MKQTSTPRPRLLVLALAGTLGLTACNSTRNGELLSSFEDISAGYVGSGLKVRQIRTMSVNGQMPFTDIGSLYYYKPGRGNLSAVGMTFDQSGSDTAFTDAIEVIQNFDRGTNTEFRDLLLIRSNLLRVASASAQVIARQRQRLEAAEEAESLRKLSKEGKDEPTRTAAATSLTSTTTKLSQAETNLNTTQTNLQDAVAQATLLLTNANTFIFRWEADKRAAASIDGGESFGAKLRAELGRSGFVIVGGMRARTLYYGQKSGEKLEAEVEKRLRIGCDTVLTDWLPWNYGAGYHVVTHLREAQNIVFLSEEALLLALNAHVTLDPKSKNFKAPDKLALELALSSIRSVGNAGIVRCTGESKRPVVIGGVPFAGSPSFTTTNSVIVTGNSVSITNVSASVTVSPQSTFVINGTNTYAFTGMDTFGVTNGTATWTPIMAVTTRLRDLDELFRSKPLKQ